MLPTPTARRVTVLLILAVATAAALWLSDLALRGDADHGRVNPETEVSASSRQPCASRIEELGLPAEVDPDDPRLHADHLLIAVKSSGHLYRLVHGQITHCWPISDGPEAGHKRVEGDRRTPEGWYLTSDKPESNYAGAISIHYPNRVDADRALAAGAIDEPTHRAIADALAAGLRPPQHTPLGGDILIHGNGEPWTLGCLSLTDDDLAALRAVLPDGMATDILIVP